MFCSRCGLTVQEGNRFCQGCGQQVGAIASTAPIDANPPIQTAGSVSLAPQPYAGFWLRLVAIIIDGLILAIPTWLVLIAMFFLFGGVALLAHMSEMGRNNDPRAVFALMAPLFSAFVLAWLILMIMHWLYFAAMESSSREATFGKLAMSLRVTDLEGRRLSFGKATGRFFAKFLIQLVPLGILTYVMAGFTEKKQALHDMIAGTLVVRKM